MSRDKYDNNDDNDDNDDNDNDQKNDWKQFYRKLYSSINFYSNIGYIGIKSCFFSKDCC